VKTLLCFKLFSPVKSLKFLLFNYRKVPPRFIPINFPLIPTEQPPLLPMSNVRECFDAGEVFAFGAFPSDPPVALSLEKNLPAFSSSQVALYKDLIAPILLPLCERGFSPDINKEFLPFLDLDFFSVGEGVLVFLIVTQPFQFWRGGGVLGGCRPKKPKMVMLVCVFLPFSTPPTSASTQS